MIYLSVLLGLFIACILCVFSCIIYSKWKSFCDLKKGDSCYIASNSNTLDDPLETEEITKVDTDISGQTMRIYTKDSSYSFFDFLLHNVRIADDF